MAERRVEVVSIDAGAVALRALGPCSECSGCGGRCSWFRDAMPAGTLSVPPGAFPRPPRPAEAWRLQLGDRELLQQALRGYGAALLGLVAGALAGHLAASLLAWPDDATTAAAALFGTLLAVRVSKRTPGAALRLLPDVP